MQGGFATAEIIIVHCGQIVVDKGVGVGEFDGDCGFDGGFPADAEEAGGAGGEEGTQAFTAGECGIAHGF